MMCAGDDGKQAISKKKILFLRKHERQKLREINTANN